MEGSSDIYELFYAKLHEAGMRRTPERLAVLNALYRSETMLGVKELLQKIEAQRFRISRATLYNVLELLCEWGLAVRMQLNEGRVVYGRSDCITPQLVLQCRKCGELYYTEFPSWQKLLGDSYAEYGFLIENQKVLVRGLCKKCKKD